MSEGDRLSEGEHWTRERLAALRDGGWRPAAWVRLIAAAHIRARRTWARAPRLARQADAYAFIASGLTLVGARRSKDARVAIAVWSLACWAMLRWHLGMLERPDGRPASRLGAGDVTTLARLWSAPLIAVASQRRVPVVLGFAAVTDVLDGPLARRAGATRLGRDLDSAGDLAVLAASVARPGLIGWAPRLTLGARVLAPVAAATYGYLADAARPPWAHTRAGRRAAAPTLIGIALSAWGARRSGGALVIAGSAAALHALARTLREPTAALDGSLAPEAAAPPLRDPVPT